MHKFITTIILFLLLLSSNALAGDDKTFTVIAPNIKGPLDILGIIYYGSLRPTNLYCGYTNCSFTITGARYWHDSNKPDTLVVFVGKDKNHLCALAFNDNGGFWKNQIQLVTTQCIGDWTISSIYNEQILVNGQ